MTPIHLTDDEIEALTRGVTQNAARCRHLQRLGLTVHRRPDGSPLVFRQQPTPQTTQPAHGPRWTK